MTSFKDISMNNVLFNSTGDYLIGEIIMWPIGDGDKIPYGFLDCVGGSVSTTTYSKLFDVIGYKYGGSGNSFNLPNLNRGAANGVRTYVKGFSDYNNIANMSTVTGGNNQIGDEQVPNHNHNVSENIAVTVDISNSFNATTITSISSKNANSKRANETNNIVSSTNLQRIKAEDSGDAMWLDHKHSFDEVYNTIANNHTVNAISSDLVSNFQYTISESSDVNTQEHYMPKSTFVKYLIYAGE